MSTPFKVIAFDVDGTLIDNSIIQPLHDLFHFSQEEDKRYVKLYLNGSISLRDWFQDISDAYAKYPASFDDVMGANSYMRFMPHVEQVMAELNKTYATAVISSGYSTYVSEVAKKLRIPHAYYFCKFIFNKEGLFEKIQFTSEASETEAKVESIKDLQKIYNAKPDEIMFVGDSINDLAVFEYTGRGVLLGEGDEQLKKAAWKTVVSLKEILTFL